MNNSTPKQEVADKRVKVVLPPLSSLTLSFYPMIDQPLFLFITTLQAVSSMDIIFLQCHFSQKVKN